MIEMFAGLCVVRAVYYGSFLSDQQLRSLRGVNKGKRKGTQCELWCWGDGALGGHGRSALNSLRFR